MWGGGLTPATPRAGSLHAATLPSELQWSAAPSRRELRPASRLSSTGGLSGEGSEGAEFDFPKVM